MTFKEIVDQVLRGAFDESQRADAKGWVNHRLQKMWDAEGWSFKYASTLVGIADGQQSMTFLPDDLGYVDSVQNQDGDPLTPMPDPREFYANYINATSPDEGDPEAFTVLDGVILVGPRPNVTRADYTLIYEKQLTLLSGDNDVPAVPEGYHLALVHGAKAEGYTMRNIVAFAQSFEALWQQALASMAGAFLETVRDPGEVWSGRYRPEDW